MNIGFDLSQAGNEGTGISEYFREMVRAAVRHDRESTFSLINTKWRPVTNHGIAGKNVNTVFLHPRSFTGRFRRRVLKRDDHTRFRKHLRKLDLLHWNATTEDDGPFLEELPWVKKVATVYDATTLLFPELHTECTIRIWDKHFDDIVKYDSWWTTISQSAFDDLVRLRGLDPARGLIVYPCNRFEGKTEEPVTTDLRKRLGIEQSPYVLSVGTLEPRKNYERLIAAFSQILDRDRGLRDWKLVIAGRTGWRCDGIVRAAQESPDTILAGCVTMSELAELYRHAEVFAYPSLYEGFGLPVIEAMGFGTPVLTSNTSSLPEAAGDAGVLVNPLDQEELRDQLAVLMSDAGQREKRRALGLKHSQRFSRERMGEQVMEFFRRIAGTKNRSAVVSCSSAHC